MKANYVVYSDGIESMALKHFSNGVNIAFYFHVLY